MKDYWVDEGRSFEFPITKETLEYLHKDYGEDAAQLVERQFISIMKEMNVKAGDQDDHTLNVRMHTTLPVAIGNDDLRMSGYMGKGLKRLNQYGKIAHATMYREQNAPSACGHEREIWYTERQGETYVRSNFRLTRSD